MTAVKANLLGFGREGLHGAGLRPWPSYVALRTIIGPARAGAPGDVHEDRDDGERGVDRLELG